MRGVVLVGGDMVGQVPGIGMEVNIVERVVEGSLIKPGEESGIWKYACGVAETAYMGGYWRPRERLLLLLLRYWHLQRWRKPAPRKKERVAVDAGEPMMTRLRHRQGGVDGRGQAMQLSRPVTVKVNRSTYYMR